MQGEHPHVPGAVYMRAPAREHAQASGEAGVVDADRHRLKVGVESRDGESLLALGGAEERVDRVDAASRRVDADALREREAVAARRVRGEVRARRCAACRVELDDAGVGLGT